MSKFFFLLSIWFNFSLARSTQPLALSWSSDSFGPDGPWSAVEVKIGSNSQPLNLYPGGSFSSNILNVSGCTGSKSCYAQNASSVYNSNTSTSFVNGEVYYTNVPSSDFTGVLGVTSTTKTNVYSGDSFNIEGYNIPNVDMALWNDLSVPLSDGTEYPIEVGTLSLGGGSGKNLVNQTFSEGTGVPAVNYSLITGTLWDTKIIPSNAWGMHIGSVKPSVTPSLVLGGFDQLHVLPPVSTQNGGPGDIDLLDIELNVVQGASPFKGNFTSLSGLVAENNDTIAKAGFLTVNANPLSPYISLPKSTCDAIAAQLPVTYNSKYSLYLWNTADPVYQKIVASATALSFIFRKDDSNDQNITINVPFLLLNLTLTEPIMSPDTPYFPCNALTSSDSDKYTLGRAFLQAAFIGANWNTNIWWLAQAPGPNIADGTAIMTINQEDTNISASNSAWDVSWSRNWVTLQDSPDGTPTGTATGTAALSTSTGSSISASSTAKASSSSLSTGAKAGIGAGVGIAALACILGAGIYFLRRHRAPSNSSINGSANPMMPIADQGHHDPNMPHYGELDGGAPMSVTEYYKPIPLRHEMGEGEHRAELEAADHRAELET